MVSKGKALAAALLVVVVVPTLAAGLVACSSSGAGGGSGATATGSAADRAASVLGHEPTGLAKTIVDRGELVVANDADYAPQSSRNDAGQLEGFDVDVADLVGEALGLKITFVNPRWDAVVSGLRDKKWDVSIGSMPVTPELSRAVGFADPYSYTQSQLLVKQGSPAIKTLEQFKGKIGVGAQTTYQYFLNAIGGVEVISYDTDLGALSALENGDIDGAMTAAQTASEAISSGKPFALSGKPFYYEPLAFAVAKGNDDLLALFNYSVKWMRDNGKLSEASKRWYQGFDVTRAPAPGVSTYDEVMAQLKS